VEAESLLEAGVLGFLRHLGECLEDLVLRVVQIAELVHIELLKILAGHVPSCGKWVHRYLVAGPAITGAARTGDGRQVAYHGPRRTWSDVVSRGAPG
jgi:hypothetical protein